MSRALLPVLLAAIVSRTGARYAVPAATTVEVAANGRPLVLAENGQGASEPADTTEEPAELVQADTTEEPAELVQADTTEEPAELVQADTTEEPAELVQADTTEEPAELVRADTTEEPAELVQADTTEEPAELVQADTTEEPAELVQADTTEEPAELVQADTTEEPSELVQADTTEEPAELVQAGNSNPRLAAVATAIVKIQNLITFAKNISDMSIAMTKQDGYLEKDVKDSLSHVGLNMKLFKDGMSMVPNQDRLLLKVKELESETKALEAPLAKLGLA